MENSMTSGDYLNPDGGSPKKSNFGIVASIIVVAIVAAAGYWYYYNSSGTEPQEVAESTEVAVSVKTPEEIAAEKLLKAQREELDKLRAVYQTKKASQPTIASTTLQAQVQTLDTLRAESLKQQTTTTVAPKTIEQEIQELDALREAARNSY